MAKMVDLTGQRFGSWTAEYPVRKNKKIYWHCKCDCGTEKDIYSSNLKSGKTKSCGCQRGSAISQKIKNDLVGQRFGNLNVLEETNERQCGAIVWRCRCDCGKETLVATGNLVSGHTTSCGCKKLISIPRRESLAGKRFGRLTVLERIPGGNGREVRWKCKCDCGNEVEILQDCLTRNEFTQSCGCLKSKGEEKIISLLRKYGIPFTYQKKFANCKYPNGYSPVFDFYVDNSYIIEYDGIQHYEVKGWNTPELLAINQSRDTFKNNWCKENNIPLIRIPYTQLSKLTIDDLLLERSNFIWQSEEATQQKPQLSTLS